MKNISQNSEEEKDEDKDKKEEDGNENRKESIVGFEKVEEKILEQTLLLTSYWIIGIVFFITVLGFKLIFSFNCVSKKKI